MKTRQSFIALTVAAALTVGASAAQAKSFQAERSLPIGAAASSHTSVSKKLGIRCQAAKVIRDEERLMGPARADVRGCAPKS
jgi:hypothetical protein